MPQSDTHHPRRRPLLRAGGAAALALWAVLAGIRHRGERVRHVGLTLATRAPGVWAVDLAQPARAKAPPLPTSPFAGQKRPPCGGAQVELRGGCWYRVQPDAAKLPPGEVCSPELYQDGKSCYLPVLDAGPTPVARSE